MEAQAANTHTISDILHHIASNSPIVDSVGSSSEQALFSYLLKKGEFIINLNDPFTPGLATGDVDDYLAILSCIIYLMKNSNKLALFVILDTHITPFLIKFFKKLRTICSNFLVMNQTNLLVLLSFIEQNNINIDKLNIMSPIPIDGLCEKIVDLIIAGKIKECLHQGGEVGYNNKSNKSEAFNALFRNGLISYLTNKATNISLPLSATGTQPHLLGMYARLKNICLMPPDLPYAISVLLTKAQSIYGNTGSTSARIFEYNPDVIEITPRVHEALQKYIDSLIFHLRQRNPDADEADIQKAIDQLNRVIFGDAGYTASVANMICSILRNPDDIVSAKGTIKSMAEIFPITVTIKPGEFTCPLFDLVTMFISFSNIKITTTEEIEALTASSEFQKSLAEHLSEIFTILNELDLLNIEEFS